VRHLKYFCENKFLSHSSKSLQRNICRGVSVSRNFNSNRSIVIKSPYTPIEFPKLSVEQYVWENYENWMNKVAVVS
jgi:hypothetical protein